MANSHICITHNYKYCDIRMRAQICQIILFDCSPLFDKCFCPPLSLWCVDFTLDYFVYDCFAMTTTNNVLLLGCVGVLMTFK